MELDDDVDGWTSKESNEKSDFEEQSDIGADVVDRICKKVHEVECFPQALAVLGPAVAHLLQQPTWKQVVAGLFMLRQIIEYVDESVLDQMLHTIKGQLQAVHPRMRNAAWGCVLELAVHHEDAAASDEWSAKLLPDFLTGLDDGCPRNVLQCMEAFHHYGEHVDRDNLTPFAQPLMAKLGQKLQGTQLVISREAITCIAVIAQQMQDSFAQYYVDLMPILKNLISQTIHKVEERTLLGKAFECVSLLANTVSQETFRPDAEVILESMIRATQLPALPKDDPVKEYTMAAAERICCTLRDEFLPFIPHFLPLVLEKMQVTPTEYDSSDLGNFNIDSENCSLAFVPTNDGDTKIFVMSSSELEDVQNALDCVHTFVEKLGPKYIPYVAETAKALLPIFEFTMNEKIRDTAFETWGQLCHAARAAGQARDVADLFKEFMSRIMPKLENQSIALEETTTLANGVKSCLIEAGPELLCGEQVRYITSVCLKVFDFSFARTRQMKALTKSETAQLRVEDDDDDDEDDDDSLEQGEEMLLRQAMNNVCTAIMTHHPDLFIAEGLPLYLPLVQQLLQPGPLLDDRLLSCFYILASWGEHLGHKVVPHWPSFLPQLLQHIDNKSSKLRMAACYGCSFFARENAFAQFASDVAGKLAEIIAQTRAKGRRKSEKEAQMAADNAVSALMEILLHHEAAVEATKAQLWAVWTAGLPCQEDDDEGKRNHGTLVQLVEKQKVEVIGLNGSNIPHVLSVLVDVYRTEMVDDVANWGIGQLLVKVGKDQLEQYSASFSSKQRKKVSRALQDTLRDSGRIRTTIA